MVSFIAAHRQSHGVESICRQLPIAPSTYHEAKARQADSPRLLPRAKRDAQLLSEIQRVYDANLRVYGAKKVWRQLHRERWEVARCTVERLMARLGLYGAVRGSKKHRTTIPDTAATRPADRVNRQFQAERPNQLWVADFTYVATWSGVVFVAFVIDMFARRIVGWRVSRCMKAQLVLDALEQALWARGDADGLIHHSDRGSQYLAIRYTERLAQAGIQCSVGTTGNSYDNALAESIVRLFKTEVIHARGPWKSIDPVEYATLEWVDWFNHPRLLSPIGDVPPAEFEQAYYDQLDESARAA
jgi:putative transposase